MRFKPGIEIPLRPFPGTLAVGIDPDDPSPRKGGDKDPMAPVSTLRPWKNGSNMDINELTEGTTLFVPVFLKGGLMTADCRVSQVVDVRKGVHCMVPKSIFAPTRAAKHEK